MTIMTWLDGDWFEGNRPILGPMTQATWLSAIVFDGARAFEGVAPDLGLHCARTVRSCEPLGLNPVVPTGQILELAREGIAKFPRGSELYIRPMFWAEDGMVTPDPASTRFAITLLDVPMPAPTGISTGLSRYRRPQPDMAPTDAKASCLYPNAGRALREVKARGFDNAVMLDANGNVAEFATANLFIVKEGVAHTPIPNGTFLNGITRQRVIKLLRDAGVEVHERSITPVELSTADEIFSTGNLGKVIPVTRYEDHEMQPGPVFTRARELYWDFAHREG